MPFTLSHPAAVLPLGGSALPLVGLVAGSMVPDVPVFLGWHQVYALSHSFLGVVTLDPAVALVVVLFWFGLARDALVDLSPAVVRSRLPATVSLSRREWLLIPVAASVGSLTHVVWDAFTHPGRWGSNSIAWLHEEHEGLLGAKWAQYGSGALGLALVLWSTASYLRRLERRPGPQPARVLHPVFLVVALLVAAAVGLVAAGNRLSAGFHAMAFHGVVNGLITLVVCVASACLLWQVVARVRPVPG